MQEPAWRRWLYLTFLSTGIAALFGGAWWRLPGREIPILGPIIHVPVLGFVALAAAGLVWLRPRPTPYALGVLCVLVALVGFWLGSPAGGWWLGSLLHDPGYGPYGGRNFGLLFVLLPVGWVLLGASVADWKGGVISYLTPGVVLVLGTVLTSGAAGPLMPSWLPVYLLLGWPAVILIVLGTFGHTCG
jgi:hypothetical protein